MADWRLRSATQALFNPGAIIPFIVGSLSLGILSSSLYDLLKALTVKDPNGAVFGLARIAISTFLILIAMVVILAVIITRLANSKRVAKSIAGPVKRKGLIFLVSNEVPARKAIEFHLAELEHLWLICSESTKGIAEGLAQSYAGSGKGKLTVHPLDVVEDAHVNDPLEFRRRVNGIYDRLPPGIGPGDVISDYLGMTAHASVGMVLACLEADRPLEYTVPVFDANRKVIGAADPMEILLDWQTIGAGPEKKGMPNP